jgi:hypothetical protein
MTPALSCNSVALSFKVLAQAALDPAALLLARQTLKPTAIQFRGISRTQPLKRDSRAISMRTVRLTEGSHATAAGIKANGTFREALF